MENSRANKLSHREVIKASRALEAMWSEIEQNSPTMVSVAETLGRIVGFPLNARNVKSLAQDLDKAWPDQRRFSPPDIEELATQIRNLKLAFKKLVRHYESEFGLSEKTREILKLIEDPVETSDVSL